MKYAGEYSVQIVCVSVYHSIAKLNSPFNVFVMNVVPLWFHFFFLVCVTHTEFFLQPVAVFNYCHRTNCRFWLYRSLNVQLNLFIYFSLARAICHWLIWSIFHRDDDEFFCRCSPFICNWIRKWHNFIISDDCNNNFFALYPPLSLSLSRPFVIVVSTI